MPYTYSEKTKDLILEKLPEARRSFLKEYAYAIENKHDTWVYPSYRFSCDRRVLNSLESRFSESELIQNLNDCLNKILLGLSETDYYYAYEKDWT